MNLNPLFSNAIKKGSVIINYQSVRWRRSRKPFWLGLAKSKMFVIREPKLVFTPEEKQTNCLLQVRYNTQLKSVLNFIRNENPRLVEPVAVDEEGAVKLDPALEEKISLSLKVNEEWNEESKRLGEKWMEKITAEEAEKIFELMDEDEKKKKVEQERIDEVIRKEKAFSESYITPENIDEAIENCLKNIEEFDFAIDLKGNRFYGRESLEKVSEQNEVKASAVLAEGSQN